MPKPGPTELPILPALPALDDTSFYAKADVPHGKVEQATYTNHAGKDKRMHVYLPPGYEADADARYPVLYLNHGGGDDDSKWTSTDPRQGGHAQFILDNLIAARKAKPMIVVMPNTRGIASPNPPKPGEDDACSQEFLKDIIPYVERHYRAKPGRENRALAGPVDGRVRRDEHRPVAPRHLRRAVRLQLRLLPRPGRRRSRRTSRRS